MDFAKYARMDYKELYNEAVGNLKSNQAKEAYKKMKTMAKYNPNFKILNVKTGPLKGKFREETKGLVLTKEEDINKEIKAFITHHYASHEKI